MLPKSAVWEFFSNEDFAILTCILCDTKVKRGAGDPTGKTGKA